MKLVIVESPTKAKTIGKYLGKEYEVLASAGHIRDLPKSNKKAIDIEGGFIPHYEIVKGKEKIVEDIKRAAKKATEVILTTDPDREGEAIAWHIKEACGLINPKRVVVHEITEPAIREALLHPREIDENLRHAQEARRVLDRLFGYDLSGLIWKKVRYGLSAGRVQSPALRILVEREREIKAFIPEKFWVIEGVFKLKDNTEIQLKCNDEPKTIEEVERILKIAEKNKNWIVVEVSQTEVKRSPRPPYITSTLQQSASSRLGFSPSRTMGIAQKLYEQGHITYMRTDSVTMSAIALKEIHSEIVKEYGKEYLEPRVYKSKSKSAQEAHEAIRPTRVASHEAGINEEQNELYKLIWDRAVSSQMADAKILRTKVSANVSEKSDIPNFSVNGSVILFPGWLKADTRARGEDVELPKIKEQDPITLLSIASIGKETEPPPRYTEAGLVKELEKREIGRPSTYATIIKTIVDRGYVEKIQKALKPTDTGEVVSGFLEQNFTHYISDAFTSEMEGHLDEIAEGKAKYLKTLKDFYGPFKKEVKAKDKIEKITNLGDAPAEFKCPICGSDMVIKLSKNGKFLSCKKFPECPGARRIDGSVMEQPKETGELCPDDGGKLIEREGRFGKFVACANYPKCKFIKKSAEEEERGKTGVKCPTCGTGEMVERRGRFGIFYSCSTYPQCKNAIKAKPTGKLCEYMRDGKPCGHLMMEGTKTIPERCSDKTCPMHNPHKLEPKK